jgi:pSer/pThr/pTyr-binding forkhead associated (FHA) protein
MRLVIKQGDRIVNEYRFSRGPIYIGRHANSQIFLPDRVVSRHHAVIFSTQDGKWTVEDLDSTNKTYLNNEPIHKSEIKTGDTLRITDFTIEITLEDVTDADKPIDLEDTLTKTSYGLEDTRTKTTYGFKDALTKTFHGSQMVSRKIDSERAPDIKLPAKRVKDFTQATEAICEARGIDEILKVLLNVATKQFSAYHTWCSLRNQPMGPFACKAGKRRDGHPVKRNEIKLSEKINQAIDNCQFLLFPRIPAEREKERIHSAMIAPIMGPGGCFGVLYIDNALDHEHYTLGDLDYLMLIAIHTAAILKNF